MKKLKQAIVAIVLLLVGGGGTYVAVENFTLGGNNQANAQTIIGSSSNLVSLPNSMVFENSTTTDDGGSVIDGGFLVNQLVRTDGIETVNLNIMALGGTATSTLYVRQMGSHDGTNFFDLATSTTNYLNPGTGLRIPTSTPVTIAPSGFVLIPGTATTTIIIPLQTTGHKWTRFLMYGDNLSTDPDDGVQAWIQAIIVDKTK